MPDISRACAEIARSSHQADRRRRARLRFRSLIAPIDQAIERLEQFNLADRGGCPPDPETAATIRHALLPLAPEIRECFRAGQGTVQEAMDGLYSVEDALQVERYAELLEEDYQLDERRLDGWEVPHRRAIW
jgi:hypothetical protein